MSNFLTRHADNVNWDEAMKKAAVKYHIAGAWVAVIFDIVFGATDYINVPEHFTTFMIFRVSVSALTGLLLILRKPFKMSSEFLIFVPFFLISVQNAFMWSLMDAEHMQKHTMAYVALFIAAGMLVIWKIKWSIVVVVGSIVANIIFLSVNSTLSVEDILVNGGLLTGCVMIFSIILINTRFNLTKREIIARLSLEQSNRKLEDQKRIIEEKNRDITASLRYAKTIQDSVLPKEQFITKHLPHSFVFYKPRDIVSGDFYWYRHLDGISYLAAVDCTGHGVPGAFMSMIGNTLLNKLIPEFSNPSAILSEMRKEVINTLNTTQDSTQSDGMDLALCVIDHDQKNLQYAGAFNPFIMFRQGELTEIKGDRMPIGKYFGKTKDFTTHTIDIQNGDVFYVFSDGFQDQLDSTGQRKYSSRRFKQLLEEIHSKPPYEQLETLETEINTWKGDEDQLDDMLIIGVKILDTDETT